MHVNRTGILLKPTNARVVIRPFELGNEKRTERVIARIAGLSDLEVDTQFVRVMHDFNTRHQLIREFFLHRYDQVSRYRITDLPISENRRLLIGAYFTQEYALESTALFNPAMIWHPDQSGLPEGTRRFILSLRAIGEGHLSSIAFREGTIDRDCQIRVSEPTRLVTVPDLIPNAMYEKALFYRKLIELGVANSFTEQALGALGEQFTLQELEQSLNRLLLSNRQRLRELEPIAQTILLLAKANYEIRFDPHLNLSERIIFPSSPTETNGIEDARFVRFQYEDERISYYATYTAYDGRTTFPQMLETEDFLHFKISTLNGPEVKNKGFALFPRKINGLYAMLSRQDNENLYLMYSDQPHFWYTRELIARPTYPWEYIQLGNCGSPIETDAGWLVLTHGVGPMRRYSMGAYLLDLNQPTRLIGRLDQPLIEPDAIEREGYVPNVVYSCGAIVHHEQLVIPYAMSDYASTFATVPLQEVLDAMTPV